jgi:hypothetical protein
MIHYFGVSNKYYADEVVEYYILIISGRTWSQGIVEAQNYLAVSSTRALIQVFIESVNPDIGLLYFIAVEFLSGNNIFYEIRCGLVNMPVT